MEYQQQIEFNKARGTKEIFVDFWTFIKSEWQSYILALGVFVLPFSLLGGYFLMQQDFEVLVDSGSIENANLSKMYIALLFSFIGKFFGIFVTCAYVLQYISGKRFDFDYLKDFLRQNFVPAFGATIFMMALLIFGFSLFIIPGLLLLPSLSLMVYDVLFARQNVISSFSRCLNLCRTNRAQSYGVVFLCYSLIIFAGILIGYIVPSDNSFAGIFISSVLTVVSETVMVPFIMLYYSLANQNMRL